jgi:hypothetical protein
MALGTVRRALRCAQNGERKVPKFSRSVGLHCRTGPRYGRFFSSIIVVNMKGCALGLRTDLAAKARSGFLLLQPAN